MSRPPALRGPTAGSAPLTKNALPVTATPIGQGNVGPMYPESPVPGLLAWKC
ncbi:hypothetical protein RCH07_000655 [Arthrobacter sp. CG_A4]|nr:hypothetical protein [Arthrobacter sp. CG_A4]